MLSFCIKDTKLSSFPKEASLTEQLNWLAIYCKKTEHRLYLRVLILCGEDDNFLKMIYFKDAVSSGLQLIAMLIRDLPLAKRTGLLRLITQEIHTEVLGLFENRLKTLCQTLESFFAMLNISLDDKPKTKKLSLNDKIKSVITSPLYSKESEEIEEINSSDKKQIKTIMQEKGRVSWQQNDEILFINELNPIIKEINANVI